MAGQLYGKVGQATALPEGGKGKLEQQLHWEIKMAVIVSCTGKSGLLKGSRMGRVKTVGSLCCWVCAGVLICWWCWEVHCLIALLPVQVEVEESRTA